MTSKQQMEWNAMISNGVEMAYLLGMKQVRDAARVKVMDWAAIERAWKDLAKLGAFLQSSAPIDLVGEATRTRDGKKLRQVARDGLKTLPKLLPPDRWPPSAVANPTH